MRKIVEVGDWLEIPVKAAAELGELGEVVRQRAPTLFRSKQAPYGLVQERAEIPDELKPLLPRRWERIGKVLLLKLPGELEAHSKEVCEAYAGVLGVKSVFDASGGVKGAWRVPRVRLLWGNGSVTTHTENGIRLTLDVRKVMLSSGNVSERIRMSRVCTPGEVVVDLFAGIGYFALPMAVHGQAQRVYACEVNPTAYEYLVENVRLNGADAVVPLLGDCMDVAPEGVADRVVLGYLRETRLYLPKALRCLRAGGWIHYHEACPDVKGSRLLAHLKHAARSMDKVVRMEAIRRVKSYSPGVSHWVLDAFIT